MPIRATSGGCGREKLSRRSCIHRARKGV